MSISACSPGLPAYESPDCGQPNPNVGGVKYFIIANDTAVAAINFDKTDMSVWQAQLNVPNTDIVGPVLGEVPAATPETVTLTSCTPDFANTYTRTLTFTDHNTGSDNTAFWNDLKDNSLNFSFGYVGCDGFFYGWLTDVIVTVTRVKDQTNQGQTKWEGNLSWREKDEVTPTVWDETAISWA